MLDANAKALSSVPGSGVIGWTTCTAADNIIPDLVHVAVICDGCKPTYGYIKNALDYDRCYHE